MLIDDGGIFMKNNSTTIQETYQLPSLGKLYGDNFPSEVTIRSMTTFEEKMRLGNQGFWKTITGILNAVVTSPENFDSSDMTLFDFNFLMYKMRTVSYGPTYKVQVTCPHCGKTMISKVNLDDLKVNYLDPEAKEPFTVGPLPRSGDILQCRHVRVRDQINNERKSKDILRNHPDYQGDPAYILLMTSQISSVNGESKLPIELQMYVEKMSAMDSAYFRQAYDKQINGLGLDMRCNDVCESCGESFEFDLPFNSEFFRPTFDI